MKRSRKNNTHRQGHNTVFFEVLTIMKEKKIIAITGIVLILLASYIVIDYLSKKWPNEAVSSNILSITQPVNSFTGTVDLVLGNRVLISQKQTIVQNNTSPAQPNTTPRPSLNPTPKVVTVSYQVLVTDKTSIFQPMQEASYLFKQTPPSSPSKLSIKDIKVGQLITAYSGVVDLRTLKDNVFEATTIVLPQAVSAINGTIVKIEGNSIVFDAILPPPPGTVSGSSAPAPALHKEYSISVTSTTEISRMNGATPEKLTIADLNANTQSTIYVSNDIYSQSKLVALRIMPLSTPPPLAPPQAVEQPGVSPTPTP